MRKKMSLVSRCLKRFHNGKKSNFTIDHILNVAGENQKKERLNFCMAEMEERGKFEWLNCTRYKPPKLPRQRRKDGIQRKQGRNPRIPFSSSQVAFLEAKFLRTPYLSSDDVTQLASYLKLTENRVKIWFQNRRAREKRENERKKKLTASIKINSSLSNFSRVSSNQKFLLKPETNSSLIFPTPLTYITKCAGSEYYSIAIPLDLSEKQFVQRTK